MRTRKVIAGLLATAMVLTGLSIAPKKAEAAAASGVVYEMFDVSDAESCIGVSAPVFDGVEGGFDVNFDEVNLEQTADYLFGGWYIVPEEGDFVPVSNVADLSEIGELDVVVAKWVPASVLGVKAQNHAAVEEGTTADIRVLSSVDCLDYASVGFAIEINNNGQELEGAAAGTTKVYDKLLASGTTYTANQIFGADANYFVAWKLTNIPAKGHDDIIYVRPYWVTADGIRVNGLGKYVHVEDGYKGYVSVPVNLNMLSADKVAAGVFEISYDSSKLTLVEDKVEAGRVFGELEFADKGDSIKFAANVADITKNADANDIYVNLRFEVKGGGTPAHTDYDFEIIGTPDFCDKEETTKEIDIWDVLY